MHLLSLGLCCTAAPAVPCQRAFSPVEAALSAQKFQGTKVLGISTQATTGKSWCINTLSPSPLRQSNCEGLFHDGSQAPGHSQHVGNDSHTPHVRREGHKFIVDHFRGQELWSAEVHLQLLPRLVPGEEKVQRTMGVSPERRCGGWD